MKSFVCPIGKKRITLEKPFYVIPQQNPQKRNPVAAAKIKIIGRQRSAISQNILEAIGSIFKGIRDNAKLPFRRIVVSLPTN